MDIKLKTCPFCGGEPVLKWVGYRKQFVVYFCSKCGKTLVHHDEARCTEWGARRVWNRRADDGH